MYNSCGNCVLFATKVKIDFLGFFFQNLLFHYSLHFFSYWSFQTDESDKLRIHMFWTLDQELEFGKLFIFYMMHFEEFWKLFWN